MSTQDVFLFCLVWFTLHLFHYASKTRRKIIDSVVHPERSKRRWLVLGQERGRRQRGRVGKRFSKRHQNCSQTDPFQTLNSVFLCELGRNFHNFMGAQKTNQQNDPHIASISGAVGTKIRRPLGRSLRTLQGEGLPSPLLNPCPARYQKVT